MGSFIIKPSIALDTKYYQAVIDILNPMMLFYLTSKFMILNKVYAYITLNITTQF